MLLLIGLSRGALFCGCKKQDAAVSDAAAAYQQIPESKEILAALEQKNYELAVSTLLKAKDTVTTEDQQSAYGALSMEVKNKLIDAAPSDPKASDALGALRFATLGR